MPHVRPCTLHARGAVCPVRERRRSVRGCDGHRNRIRNRRRVFPRLRIEERIHNARNLQLSRTLRHQDDLVVPRPHQPPVYHPAPIRRRRLEHTPILELRPGRIRQCLDVPFPRNRHRKLHRLIDLPLPTVVHLRRYVEPSHRSCEARRRARRQRTHLHAYRFGFQIVGRREEVDRHRQLGRFDVDRPNHAGKEHRLQLDHRIPVEADRIRVFRLIGLLDVPKARKVRRLILRPSVLSKLRKRRPPIEPKRVRNLLPQVRALIVHRRRNEHRRISLVPLRLALRGGISRTRRPVPRLQPAIHPNLDLLRAVYPPANHNLDRRNRYRPFTRRNEWVAEGYLGANRSVYSSREATDRRQPGPAQSSKPAKFWLPGV